MYYHPDTPLPLGSHLRIMVSMPLRGRPHVTARFGLGQPELASRRRPADSQPRLSVSQRNVFVGAEFRGRRLPSEYQVLRREIKK